MRKIALVFVGGFCGALARYLVAMPLASLARHHFPGASSFPYEIFVINLSGAYLLGLLYGMTERGAAIPPGVRLALGTGFLGAYTTFSTFITGGDAALMAGARSSGVAYLFGSIALGVICVHLGHLSAVGLTERRRRGYAMREHRTARGRIAPSSPVSADARERAEGQAEDTQAAEKIG
jgi:CrcB protein